MNPSFEFLKTKMPRTLVRGVNWLGDAIMSTPALQRLREARPWTHITLLTPAKLAGLWDNHPSIDAVLTFAPGESVWRISRKIQAADCQTALILPNSPRSALETWMAGVAERIGYARPWRNGLLTVRVPPRAGSVPMLKRSTPAVRKLIEYRSMERPLSFGPEAHHIYDYLHLAAVLGANTTPAPPFVTVTVDELERIRQRFQLPPDPRKPLFALHPGAEYGPAKQWPLDRFIAAAAQIQKQTECRWLILGTQGEATLAETVTHGVRELARTAGLVEPEVRNLAGQTSLRELCGVLKAADVLLCNDSGPMHLATAVGTPVVVPFGSTAPELTGPGVPGNNLHRVLRVRVPCAPCFRRDCPIDFRCMQQITVEQVVEAVVQQWQQTTCPLAV